MRTNCVAKQSTAGIRLIQNMIIIMWGNGAEFIDNKQTNSLTNKHTDTQLCTLVLIIIIIKFILSFFQRVVVELS